MPKTEKRGQTLLPLFHSLSKSCWVVSLLLLQGASSAASQTCSYILGASSQQMREHVPSSLNTYLQHTLQAALHMVGCSPIHCHTDNVLSFAHQVSCMRFTRGVLTIGHMQLSSTHLMPFAVAKPAATLQDIVEGEVEAFAHPIPISSRLHQTSSEGQSS